MLRLFIFAALLGCAMAAVMQYPVKVGQKVEFKLGEKATEYHRTVDGKLQKIRRCGKTEKNVACGDWVDEEGNVVASGAIVKCDGTLLIDKATLGDTGSYSSPSDKGRVTKDEVGNFSAVPGGQVQVTVSV